MGAMTSVVVPWLVDRLDHGVTWQGMAWWIHDHCCLTASCNFSRSSPPSISAGTSCPAPNLEFCSTHAVCSLNPD